MSDQEGKSGIGKWIACGCIGCGVMVLLIVGLVVGVGGLAFFSISRSDVFQDSLERARACPDVVAVLGEPIEAGLIPQGSLSITGESGDADLAIPISGPEGEATLYVVATKRAGVWEYSVCEVQLEGSETRINLLTPTLEQEY